MANYSTLKSSGEVAVYADMNALIAATGMSDGDQAFVTATNNLYIYSTSGWYKIATVQNDSPSAITGVEGAYGLATDGTATTITAVSTDPDGFPLTWSYSTSGLGSIATVSQADNVFTITPSTDSANTGTFTLTINATDGVNGAVSANTSITLAFSIENSQYTTLLATAVDTSDNNTIADSSTNNHSITAYGNTHAGTFSPYRHGGYSAYFDGSGDYLTVTDSALELAGEFTLSCWFYLNELKDYITIFHWSDFTGNGSGFDNDVYIRASGAMLSRVRTTSTQTSTNTLSANQWYYLTVSRDSSNVIKIWINNTEEISYTSAGTLDDYISIGYNPYSGGRNYLNGYVKDFCIKNTSVTAPSVPTSPVTSDTNTKLLTCHLPYFADGSTNDHAITSGGDVSIQPFGPFDYSVYSSTNHGGSISLDGTGDYLSIAADTSFDFGSGDFTVEFWMYPRTIPSGESGLVTLYEYGSDRRSWYVALDGSKLELRLSTAGTSADTLINSATGVFKANTWYHVAMVRDGNDITGYVNGVSVVTSTHSGAVYGNPSDPVIIGSVSTSLGGDEYNGYITDVKIVKGTAVYTSAFTPTTAPLSSSGAALHIKGTDASIIDKSQIANLELVGNTVGTTAQVKFAGSKSMAFDGTGDYIKLSSPLLDFGTGDFTIECWARTTNTVNNGVFTLSTSHFSQNNPRGIAVAFYTNMYNWALYANDTTTSSVRSHTPSTNTWYHIAVVRTGGYTKLYIDGTEIESRADTKNYSNHTALAIGGYYSGSYLLPGNIQDFRVTKGLARYTANFTPPTETLQG